MVEVLTAPSQKHRDIITLAPVEVQDIIGQFADSVASEDSSRLAAHYSVGSLEELVHHIVEFECGTPYEQNMQPIKDWLTYKWVMRFVAEGPDYPALQAKFGREAEQERRERVRRGEE